MMKRSGVNEKVRANGFFRQPALVRADNGSMTDQERFARLLLHYGNMKDRRGFARDCLSGVITACRVLDDPVLCAHYGIAVSSVARERAHNDWRTARSLGLKVLTPADAAWFLPPIPGVHPIPGVQPIPGFRPPGVLFVRGRLDEVLPPKILCIVGSRAASRWATDLARECASSLAAAGWVIVSGGALGVDGAAHEGALEASGCTWVFLGSGLLAPYPARHAGLFARVVSGDGCLFSANHLYGKPDKAFFVQRNAYMAACASAVVVVEASSVSGSLHTARFALRWKKAVLAQPGSAGCNRILLEGARPFRDLDELVDGLARGGADGGGTLDENKIPMQGGLFPEEIAARTGNTLTEVFQQLQIGELNGEVLRLPGGRYLNLRYPE
jgi:DNA processing protein